MTPLGASRSPNFYSTISWERASRKHKHERHPKQTPSTLSATRLRGGVQSSLTADSWECFYGFRSEELGISW